MKDFRSEFIQICSYRDDNTLYDISYNFISFLPYFESTRFFIFVIILKLVLVVIFFTLFQNGWNDGVLLACCEIIKKESWIVV